MTELSKRAFLSKIDPTVICPFELTQISCNLIAHPPNGLISYYRLDVSINRSVSAPAPPEVDSDSSSSSTDSSPASPTTSGPSPSASAAQVFLADRELLEDWLHTFAILMGGIIVSAGSFRPHKADMVLENVKRSFVNLKASKYSSSLIKSITGLKITEGGFRVCLPSNIEGMIGEVVFTFEPEMKE
jgi:hypothetical protein